MRANRAVRDHGGGIDAAVARFGGLRADWLDLSTGINPDPYPLPGLSQDDWTALPDQAAADALVDAARVFWRVPPEADILAAPGASALIARVPALAAPGRVGIRTPTYNEHAAAFSARGWDVRESGPCDAKVLVHPNNPDGRLWTEADADAGLTIIDESFCDVCPDKSLISLTEKPGHLVLKSFGKFWGLAGMRLGFAIGPSDLIDILRDNLGPWPVSGPALKIATAALSDFDWANITRTRLATDTQILDRLMAQAGAEIVGGTTLFRLYNVDDAEAWQTRFARHRIWTRVFPYSRTLIRLGLPAANGWERLEGAL